MSAGRTSTQPQPRPEPRRTRRDRHERGLRGPLAPTDSPVSVDRTDRFGDLVVEAVDRLQPRWGRLLPEIDVEIQEAPDVRGSDVVEVPLAGHRAAHGGRPATLVLFRRPVELRAPDRPSRVALVRDLVAEQLADLLGLAPQDLDPTYDDRGED